MNNSGWITALRRAIAFLKVRKASEFAGELFFLATAAAAACFDEDFWQSPWHQVVFVCVILGMFVYRFGKLWNDHAQMVVDAAGRRKMVYSRADEAP